MLNLRWLDVEPLEDEGLGAELYLRKRKNHEPLSVFISERDYQWLLAHEQEFRRTSSSLVSPSKNLHEKYRWGVGATFRAARAAAGLSDPDEKYGEVLDIHHIRHTWAIRLGDSGATLAQLMAADGWKTPAMAMRYMKTKRRESAEAALLLLGK